MSNGRRIGKPRDEDWMEGSRRGNDKEGQVVVYNFSMSSRCPRLRTAREA